MATMHGDHGAVPTQIGRNFKIHRLILSDALHKDWQRLRGQINRKILLQYGTVCRKIFQSYQFLPPT